MNYRLLLLLAWVTIWVPIMGQGNFAPPGAEWCMQGYSAEEEPLGYILVSYDRDTMVANQSMKVMSIRIQTFRPGGVLDRVLADTELMYQSGDSVFYYVPVIRDRVYIFKERYTVGEVTTSWLYNDDFDVLEVSDEAIGGAEMSVAKLNLQPWLNRDLPVTMYGPWGPDRGFVSVWGFPDEGHGRNYLEAYRADSIPEVRIVARSQCFSLMDEPQTNFRQPTTEEGCTLAAFPNPVSSVDEWIRLRFVCFDNVPGPYELRVHDMQGRVVRQQAGLSAVPTAISVRGLPNGRYFGLLYAGDQQFEFSFVKNR